MDRAAARLSISALPITAQSKAIIHMKIMRKEGFTLVELLVVIAIIGILAGLLLPALSRAKGKGQSVVCGNNLKQLQVAWLIYADDYDGRAAGNVIRLVSGPRMEESVGGWVLGHAKFDQTDENLRKGTLWDYTKKASVYRCPTDQSKVTGESGQLRFRSYALDATINLVGYGIGIHPDFEPGGILSKVSEAYDPASNFGFADTSEASIASGGLGLHADGKKGDLYWVHQPAERHSLGANLSFLDGHIQFHKWKFTPKIHAPGARNKWRNQADLEDLRWMLDRSHLGQFRRRILGLP
jgi:prepilin-type N-terminal cleavage/methylation domain-containing protein/prepilin-type processing-associated H-X9-DG protein